MKTLRDEAGETLAEVLVSLALLSLFSALFLGAVHFSWRMADVTEAEETEVAEAVRALYAQQGTVRQEEAARYSFVLPDGTEAFSVQVPRQAVSVPVEGRQYLIRRFAEGSEP